MLQQRLAKISLETAVQLLQIIWPTISISTLRQDAEDGAPVRIGLEFRFPRPKSHYRGGKPDPDRLRKDASRLVVRRPDLDKLCRAVLDALTGVCWLDDAQVACLAAWKYYDEAPGVLIVADRVKS